jgi:serine phosphatase RsbU (regulator of sigma subunit)
LQQEQLPSIAPIVEGWEIAAAAYHAGSLGGAFYDWFALADGSLSVLAGEACPSGVEGALTASALRGAARAVGPKRASALQILPKCNSILWTGSAGSARAGLFQAIVEPGAAAVDFSTAGPIRVLAAGHDAFTTLEGPSPALGLQEERKLALRRRPLAPGELLLAYGTTFLADADEELLAALDTRLALSLAPRMRQPASELAAYAAEILQSYGASPAADRLLVVIKRRAR